MSVGRVSVGYWFIISRYMCQSNVGQVMADISANTQPTLDQYSTDTQPTLDRLSADISAMYRPSVD